MLEQQQMRFGAQIMAAIFGGPGIFYILESFAKPSDAITGLIYLVIATALALYAGRKSEPSVARQGALARCKAIIRGKRRP